MNNSIASEVEIKRIWLTDMRATMTHPDGESEIFEWDNVVSLIQRVLKRFSEMAIGCRFDADTNTLYKQEEVRPPHITCSDDIISAADRDQIFTITIPGRMDDPKTDLVPGNNGEIIVVATYPNGVRHSEILEEEMINGKIELRLCEDNSVFIQIWDEKNPEIETITWPMEEVGTILWQRMEALDISLNDTHRINNLPLLDKILGIASMSELLDSLTPERRKWLFFLVNWRCVPVFSEADTK